MVLQISMLGLIIQTMIFLGLDQSITLRASQYSLNETLGVQLHSNKGTNIPSTNALTRLA